MRSFLFIIVITTTLTLISCAHENTQHVKSNIKVDIKINKLQNCTLKVRTIGSSNKAHTPQFVMMNGVPFSSAIYTKLADKLDKKLLATSYLIDLPGTGGSHLYRGEYSRQAIRQCVQDYLTTLPSHILIIDDLALLAAFPLLIDKPTNTKGIIILNAPLKPSTTNLPFPMNFLSCCPSLAVFTELLTPRFFFIDQIRGMGIDRQKVVSEYELNAFYNELHQEDGMNNLARLLSEIERDKTSDLNIIEGLKTTIPQLFIWGTADPSLGQEHKHLYPLAKNQEIIIFNKAKHFLMLDYYNEISDVIVKWHKLNWHKSEIG